LSKQEKSFEKYKQKVHNLKAAVMTLPPFATDNVRSLSDPQENRKMDAADFGGGAAMNADTGENEKASSSIVHEFTGSERKSHTDEASKQNVSPDRSPFRDTKSPSDLDFDAALSQLFNSIDEIQVPMRKGAKGNKPVSLQEVDIRLEELHNEKERLRKMLLSQT
jgi:hypothetical protein